MSRYVYILFMDAFRKHVFERFYVHVYLMDEVK